MLNKYQLLLQAYTETILLDKKQGLSLPPGVQVFSGLLESRNGLSEEYRMDPLLAPRRNTKKMEVVPHGSVQMS